MTLNWPPATLEQADGHLPLSAYLRDPQVENVHVNGCGQVWP